MKNRAKCKLCQNIIESFHSTDYVLCKCGEISVDGGDSMRCAAKNWNNFLRVDDEGNEIIVKIKDVNAGINEPIEKKTNKPDKEELLKMLDEMIKNIENLPQNAMLMPITHYDFVSALLLLSSILR